MIKKNNRQFNCTEFVISPGEIYSSNQPVLITTVLGSCIAVCLYDGTNRIAGMNHFMLPGRYAKGNILSSEAARFGLNSMEYLITGMMKMGADRARLVAKVFGGGHVFAGIDRITVPQDNIDFVHDFLEMEGIRIVKEDTGGRDTRKIHFLTDDGRVLLRRIPSTRGAAQQVAAETNYEHEVQREQKEYLIGDLTIFE